MFTIVIVWPSTDVDTYGMFHTYDAAATEAERIERWFDEFIRVDRRRFNEAADAEPTEWAAHRVRVSRLSRVRRSTLRTEFDLQTAGEWG